MVEPNACGRALPTCAEQSWAQWHRRVPRPSPLDDDNDDDEMLVVAEEDVAVSDAAPAGVPCLPCSPRPLTVFEQGPRFTCHGSYVLMYEHAAARVLGGDGMLVRAAAVEAFHASAIAVLDLGVAGPDGRPVKPRIVIVDVGNDCVLSVLGVGKLRRPDPNLLRCQDVGPGRVPVVAVADDGAAKIYAFTQNGAFVKFGSGVYRHMVSYGGDGDVLHTVDVCGRHDQFNIWHKFYEKYAYRDANHDANAA